CVDRTFLFWCPGELCMAASMLGRWRSSPPCVQRLQIVHLYKGWRNNRRSTQIACHSLVSAHAEPGRYQEAWQESDLTSTRLNSSHVKISYAVFCLKKKTL